MPGVRLPARSGDCEIAAITATAANVVREPLTEDADQAGI
jgi:hypothetical protein